MNSKSKIENIIRHFRGFCNPNRIFPEICWRWRDGGSEEISVEITANSKELYFYDLNK